MGQRNSVAPSQHSTYDRLLRSRSNHRLLRLYIRIHPAIDLPQHMLLGLKRSISMRFQRQKHQPDRRSLALERRIKALALDWIGAGIVVRFAVNQQDRRLDLVGIAERRHIE